MSITRQNPRTVMLACKGDPLIVDDLVASEAITPGMLIETHLDSSDQKWRKNASATIVTEMAVALNRSMLNKGIDDAYAAADLVEAWKLRTGDVFYGILPSGQDIVLGDYLQSNGDGKLKEAADGDATDNVALFKALSSPGSVTADTRVIVERIQ